MKKLKFASIIALAATLFVAPNAFAHEEVIGTYPASGETVEAGQIGVMVDFSADVMANDRNEGFEVRVSDSQGNVQPVGCLEASGATLWSITSLAKPGDYTVDWRSVGNDGHAIEGTFKFSVTNTSGYEQETAEQLACATALDSSAPTVTAEGARTNGADDSAFTGLLIGASFIVIGTIAGAVAVRIKEKNAAKKPKVLYKD
jgi:methionine-rich copper-binding protein CopC